jgi:hypothetical protein
MIILINSYQRHSYVPKYTLRYFLPVHECLQDSDECHPCPACMKGLDRKLMALFHFITELTIVQRHALKHANVKVQLVPFVRIILLRVIGKWK